MSYAQTEAHYARQCGKPVWYFVLERTFPTDPHPPEPKELRSLQAAYIRRVRGYESEHHVVRDPADLTAWIRELRYELDPLRRGSRFWATGVILFVALSVVASVWLLQHRHTILQHLEQAAPPAIPAEKVDPPQQ